MCGFWKSSDQAAEDLGLLCCWRVNASGWMHFDANARVYFWVGPLS